MGYALPAALGAAAGRPDITVVCVTGDGSLQTNIQELQTLRHYGFNVKLFVISNDGYASIRNTQKGFFSGQYIGASRDSGVSLPDLEAVAASYALPYLPVRDRETLTPTLREALERSGPLIVEVHAQPEQVVIPTVASRKLANGGLRSNPLHVMHPLLPDEVLKRELGPYLDLEAFNETQAE
jgi:acetolactate synthase-1/2/3 large subunit